MGYKVLPDLSCFKFRNKYPELGAVAINLEVRTLVVREVAKQTIHRFYELPLAVAELFSKQLCVKTRFY